MDYSETLRYGMSKRAFTPSDSPQYRIKYNFFFEFNFSHWLLDQEVSTRGLKFIGQEDPITMNISVYVIVPQNVFFDETLRMCYQETTAGIQRALAHLPLDNWSGILIDFSWMHAREGVITEPICGYKDLNLDILVNIEYKDVVLDPRLETTPSCMVPAADSSIRSLGNYEIDHHSRNMREISCCICLEDFSRQGCEAVCMPCQHVFHGDCIKKWLRTSHYCPLCRFQMPTS